MTKPGIWKHYKGNLYRVVFTAYDATNGPNDGTSMVVYVSLKDGYVHVRKEREFHERVWSATYDESRKEGEPVDYQKWLDHEDLLDRCSVDRFSWTGRE
jgi:hypothetical protein